MANSRYHLESEPDGSWSVINAATNSPAVARDRVLARMQMSEAQDALNLMNWIEKLRAGAAPGTNKTGTTRS